MRQQWTGAQQGVGVPAGLKNVGGAFQQVGGLLKPGQVAPANAAPGVPGAWQRAAPAAPAVVAQAQERPTAERERSKAPASSKMQPQLQHLPRFQPPSFEDANGILPCPDSPGSTDDEEGHPRKQELTFTDGNDGNSQQVLHVESNLSWDGDCSRPVEVPVVLPVALEKPPIFPPGSFVEYKSRSSGAWILAKVEDWNESSQTYRLDVQPHAQVDRVRARTSGDRPLRDLEAAARGRERDPKNEQDVAAGHDRPVGHS